MIIHAWATCHDHGRVVVCGKCGKPTCVPGYGLDEHGKPCDGCESAREMRKNDWFAGLRRETDGATIIDETRTATVCAS
jgi:hypothetical protein